MARKPATELSPLELEIMNIIWDLGECTSAQVIDEYNKIRPLANTTIRTVLSNIRKKGYVDVAPSVKPRIRFRARVSKQEVTRRNMKQMISSMFSGSPRDAIVFLLKEENIDDQEMNEIRKMIEAAAEDTDA